MLACWPIPRYKSDDNTVWVGVSRYVGLCVCQIIQQDPAACVRTFSSYTVWITYMLWLSRHTDSYSHASFIDEMDNYMPIVTI